MPKKGHSEEQIIAALKQHESGEKTAVVCASSPLHICAMAIDGSPCCSGVKDGR